MKHLCTPGLCVDILQAFYPLFYLLLMRDIEIFETAKTTVLNQEELWDSAESILYVFDAMCERLNELRGTQTRHACSDGGSDR